MNVVKSWRDLGKEGHGRAYAGASPWARQGIFIVSSQRQGQVTREAGPGLSKDHWSRIKESQAKREQPHEYVEANWTCVTCNLMREGHDRLVQKLQSSTKRRKGGKVARERDA